MKGIVGSPDIVFKKYKTVIFINGCFWHGHTECGAFKPPKTNTDFWVKKINRNRGQDLQVKQTLINQGWNVITIWECMLKKKNRENALNGLSLLLSKIVIERYRNIK